MADDEPKKKHKDNTVDDNALLLSENFSEDYANNVFFQLTWWDLKVLFGEFNQVRKPPAVEYHTAITIPWSQAKIMSYFLQVQIAYYEATNGPIKIPSGAIPDAMQLSEEWAADPKLKAVYELAKELHEKLAESAGQS